MTPVKATARVACDRSSAIREEAEPSPKQQPSSPPPVTAAQSGEEEWTASGTVATAPTTVADEAVHRRDNEQRRRATGSQQADNRSSVRLRRPASLRVQRSGRTEQKRERPRSPLLHPPSIMAGLGLAGLPIHSRSPQPPSFQGQQQQQQLVQMQPLQMQQMPAQVAAPPQPVALDAAAIMIKLASIAGEKFKARSTATATA